MGVLLSVLIVEDSEVDALFLMQELRRGGYDPVYERVETGEALSAALDRGAWDAILIDYTLPRFSGIAALELIKRKHIDLPAIIVSGTIDDETAVAAMKAGAHDYIMKNNLPRLIPALEREMRETKERQERRRIEKALQETESKYFTVFQHSPVPLAIASIEEGRLFDVNEQFIRLIGFSPDELIGHTTEELNLWADHEERKRFVRSLERNHGEIQSYPVSVRTKSGNVIKVLFSADIIKINDAPYLLSSAVDITDRLNAEEILKTQAHILDSMAEGVNLADEKGFIYFTNPAYDSIFGYERGELIGKHVSILNVGSSADNLRLSNEIIQELKTTGIWSGEFANRKKDGTPLTTRAHISAMEVSGKQFWVTVQENITERRRAEEALRESEENFRRSLDNSPLGIRIVTVEGETIYANRAVLDILSIEELNTTPLIKRYTPESYAEFQIRREKRKRGDYSPSEYEVSIVKKDGEVRHLQVFRKEIVWDGERQFQVIYQDITEREQAEEALRESEARYRQLVKYAPAAIYEADLTTGRLLSVNEVLCEYSGYTRDELLALNPLDLMTEESQKLILHRMAGYAAGEPVPPNVEYKARSKTGREFWISTNAKYFYQAGLPVRATVVAYDITDRKRAEEALRRAGENFRLSLDDSPLGVRIVTIEGETVYANRALLNIFGYDNIEELRTTPLKERYTPESYAEFQIRREKRKRGDYSPSEYEVSIVKKDGEVRHLQVFRKEIVWDGERQFQIIYQDITERKRAEEELHDSREQMRALAGRLQAVREEEGTRIAREIHDELGGALTGLKIDFSFLRRSTLKIENELVRAPLLAGIDSMTKSIDSTIQTVRRIAMELRPGVLDDLGLVAALEWQLKDLEKRTGIRCEFFPPGEDISLETDVSTALFRIFQEALTNVTRHSGATEIRVCFRGDGDSTTLEIEDNGKGIEKEKSMSSKSLGLLGMKERAQMFGGCITVTGTPGVGTKVKVEILPAEKRKIDRDQGGAAG